MPQYLHVDVSKEKKNRKGKVKMGKKPTQTMEDTMKLPREQMKSCTHTKGIEVCLWSTDGKRVRDA